MRIETFTKGNSCNSYLVTKGSNALVIDAGCCESEIMQMAADESAKISAVLLTHTHYDHIMQLDKYMHENIPVYVHADEEAWLQDSTLNVSSLFGVDYRVSKQANELVTDGQELNISGIDIHVLHTPGHTPGSVCYRIDNHLFSGDTLFRQSIGRYDLPGGDGVRLRSSIKEKLYTLPDEITVYPGHGPVTSIGYEKRNNQFVTV